MYTVASTNTIATIGKLRTAEPNGGTSALISCSIRTAAPAASAASVAERSGLVG